MQHVSLSQDRATLDAFMDGRQAAVDAVSARFETEFPDFYAQFGEQGRKACREDIAFTIDFLQPALEFGILQPFIDYIHWFRGVLDSRAIPGDHVNRLLQWLREHYRDTLPGGGAAAVAVLDAALEHMEVTEDNTDRIERCMPPAWDDATALMSMLLAGDHRGCAALLRGHLARNVTLLDVEIHLIQPALYLIGREWQANRVSVAQEHLATTTATMVMAQLAGECPPPQPNGAKVLLACVEENNHAVGLRMVADGFEQHGWDARYLGADVPIPSLVSHIVDWSPDLVGLSVSMPHQLRHVRETLERLRQDLGQDHPPVIIGGLAINSLPAISQAFGISSAPDAESMLAIATALIARNART